MTTEYGIFNDEGCVEAQFYSMPTAVDALKAYLTAGVGSGLYIAEVCPDHEEQEWYVCEECNAEDEDDCTDT